MVTKIEIMTIFGDVIFSYEKEDNSIKATIEEAVKCGADLHGADLQGAYLHGAYLHGAYLHGADLRDADLHGADLRGAELSYADLRDADLRGADLHGADLHGADLRYADLHGADLRGADLHGADLHGSENVPFIPLSCPSDGAFIGWKKVRIYKTFQIESYLVKLEIPEDARRSSATSNKCRCDKAKVLAITDLEEKETFSEVTNSEYAPCTYQVGEFVYPDSFDEDRCNECSHGIHFFINKQEAINC